MTSQAGAYEPYSRIHNIAMISCGLCTNPGPESIMLMVSNGSPWLPKSKCTSLSLEVVVKLWSRMVSHGLPWSPIWLPTTFSGGGRGLCLVGGIGRWISVESSNLFSPSASASTWLPSTCRARAASTTVGAARAAQLHAKGPLCLSTFMGALSLC